MVQVGHMVIKNVFDRLREKKEGFLHIYSPPPLEKVNHKGLKCNGVFSTF